MKQLDSNLFLGDEITEVYKEIMKTVPTDHLDMEIVSPSSPPLDPSLFFSFHFTSTIESVPVSCSISHNGKYLAR